MYKIYQCYVTKCKAKEKQGTSSVLKRACQEVQWSMSTSARKLGRGSALQAVSKSVTAESKGGLSHLRRRRGGNVKVWEGGSVIWHVFNLARCCRKISLVKLRPVPWRMDRLAVDERRWIKGWRAVRCYLFSLSVHTIAHLSR